MKQKPYIILSILIVLLSTQAHANTRASNELHPGVFYKLSPRAASVLNIDLRRLESSLKLASDQQLAFKFEEDGELNLSIYSGGAFTQLRADVVFEH